MLHNLIMSTKWQESYLETKYKAILLHLIYIQYI